MVTALSSGVVLIYIMRCSQGSGGVEVQPGRPVYRCVPRVHDTQPVGRRARAEQQASAAELCRVSLSARTWQLHHRQYGFQPLATAHAEPLATTNVQPLATRYVQPLA